MNIGPIINGLSKTLGLVNQTIPLYKQLKPIFNNSGKILSMLNIINEKNTKEEQPKEIKKESINGLPTFFQ